MRQFFSYIVAILIFFLVSSMLWHFVGGINDDGQIDTFGFLLGMIVGILAAYYVGKWTGDKVIPLHIFYVVPVCILCVVAYFIERQYGYQNLIDYLWFQVYIAGVLIAIITTVLSFCWRWLTLKITGESAIQ